jgi:hypothetical protein
MVDLRAAKKAPKMRTCPACHSRMLLAWDAYTCENKQCGHFEQDIMLQDIIERDDPANLKYCNCGHCVKERGGARL